MGILQVSKDDEQNEIKVIKWISYEDAEILSKIGMLKENNIGGLGGWFQDGHRWKDYIRRFKREAHPYQEALRREIIEKNIKYTGEEHQELSQGVPVFSDFTMATYSYRGWGDLMAAIWSTEENKDYSYVDFYMILNINNM